MKRSYTALVWLMAVILMTACAGDGPQESGGEEESVTGSVSSAGRHELVAMTMEEESLGEAALPVYLDPQGEHVRERVLTPEGFNRVTVEEGSFGAFIRDYPLLPHGTEVHLYDGSVKASQDGSLAVFDLPVISKNDVQQCADSVMRLYAEYFWQKGAYDKIKFHFVNGFLCDYDSYRGGKRVKVDGNNVTWQNTAGPDDSYETFENYLYIVFAYSSTLSMKEESRPVDIKDVRIGDMFLRAGSPGHVVMVADVCEDADGNKAFLLAQGYMPAQQFHLLKNPLHPDDPWYYVDEITYPLATPEQSFSEGSFCRPVYDQESADNL